MKHHTHTITTNPQLRSVQDFCTEYDNNHYNYDKTVVQKIITDSSCVLSAQEQTYHLAEVSIASIETELEQCNVLTYEQFIAWASNFGFHICPYEILLFMIFNYQDLNNIKIASMPIDRSLLTISNYRPTNDYSDWSKDEKPILDYPSTKPIRRTMGLREIGMLGTQEIQPYDRYIFVKK